MNSKLVDFKFQWISLKSHFNGQEPLKSIFGMTLSNYTTVSKILEWP